MISSADDTLIQTGNNSSKLKDLWPIGLILLAYLVLAFASLGSAALWDDEAQVAIIARNFSATGTLTGWDGRNLYAYRNGTLLDNNLEYINPPLDVLVVAPFMRYVHDTDSIQKKTAIPRIPFVFFGLLTLILVAALWRELVPSGIDSKRVMLYSLLALGLSVSFLLDCRTCRYYAISMAASVGILLFYKRLLRRPSIVEAAIFALLQIVLFYSSYLLFTVFLLALITVFVLFDRKAITKEHLIAIAIAASVTALFTLPWAIPQKIWMRHDVVDPNPWLPEHLKLLWWSFRDFNLFAVFPWMGALALAIVLFRAKNDGTALTSAGKQIYALLIAYLFFMALLSPQIAKEDIYSDLRYDVPILPFLGCLTGVLLAKIHQKSMPLGVLTLSVILCSNALTLLPTTFAKQFPYTPHFRWLLPAYLVEISHPYSTANAAAAKFLLQNTAQDDTVYAVLSFENYPLMYYAGYHNKFCCLLDHNSPLPPKLVYILNSQLYKEENFPDWIICFGGTKEAAQTLLYFTRVRQTPLGVNVYRPYIEAQRIPIYCNQTNRPELPDHSFSPPAVNLKTHAVYILRSAPDRLAVAP